MVDEGWRSETYGGGDGGWWVLKQAGTGEKNASYAPVLKHWPLYYKSSKENLLKEPLKENDEKKSKNMKTLKHRVQ